MIGPFAIDTYLPAFPAIEAEFDASRSLLSQTLGAYLAAFAVATLFWGPITDRFGRKKVIISGISLFIISSIGCALAKDYSHFLSFRMIQGAAASGGLVAGRAMVRDVFDSQQARQVMSYVMLFFAIAPAVAPIIGAGLHDAFGWHSIFYFLAAFGFVTLLLILAITKETLALEHRQSIHPRHVTKVYCNVLLHRRFLMIVTAGSASFCGMFLFIAGSPTIFFDFLQLTTGDFWKQFVLMVIGLMAGSLFSARFAYRKTATRMVSIAVTIIAVTTLINLMIAYFFTPSLLGFVLPLLCYAFGIGMAIPSLTILALDCFPNNRGTAAAVQSFVQMMANAIVASIVLPLVTQSYLAFAVAQLCFISLAVVLWLKVPKTA